MRFELTAETKTWMGRKVFRLKALIDFGDVKAGDTGGWAENVENIQPDGEAWVYGEALVCDKARVCGEALVCDKARVYGVDERSAKHDLWGILLKNTAEIPFLLKALQDGKVDGSVYSGECACLMGTIANAKSCNVYSLERDSNSPAEKWFLQICKGNTPENNEAVKKTVDWISEFLNLMNRGEVA